MLRKGEKRNGDFRYLLRQTNEHKFSFRLVEDGKLSKMRCGNCVLKLTYCGDKGLRCKRNKYLSVISINVMNN